MKPMLEFDNACEDIHKSYLDDVIILDLVIGR